MRRSWLGVSGVVWTRAIVSTVVSMLVVIAFAIERDRSDLQPGPATQNARGSSGADDPTLR